MTPEKILLFGDDGSAGADEAWRWIEAQRWPGWRIDVLTAHLPPPGPPPDPAEAEPHPWAPPRERRPASFAGVGSVRHLDARSDPRLALLRSDVDLVVIGPRGPGLLKGLHLGSTAEYLLHHPPAPLVIARAPRPVSRVLLCADGSPDAQGAAAALAGMPWVAEAGVWVLGVEDGRSDLGLGERLARSVLDGAARAVATHRAEGPVAWTALEVAREVRADLIALGTRGLGGVRRLVLGSTASAVARAASCAVLTVARIPAEAEDRAGPSTAEGTADR